MAPDAPPCSRASSPNPNPSPSPSPSPNPNTNTNTNPGPNPSPSPNQVLARLESRGNASHGKHLSQALTPGKRHAIREHAPKHCQAYSAPPTLPVPLPYPYPCPYPYPSSYPYPTPTCPPIPTPTPSQAYSANVVAAWMPARTGMITHYEP